MSQPSYCSDVSVADPWPASIRGECHLESTRNTQAFLDGRTPDAAQVCEHALLWAMWSQDLSFALRVCQYTDEEGMILDHELRDALFRFVSSAIKRLPDTAVVNVADANPATRADMAAAAAAAGGSEAWKVEGTNATVEELWDLDALLQRCVELRSGDCVSGRPGGGGGGAMRLSGLERLLCFDAASACFLLLSATGAAAFWRTARLLTKPRMH